MYANTCWGLLTLAVTLGLAALGLPPRYEWLVPWLLWTTGACVIGSVVCFAWPLRVKENRAKVLEFYKHPLRAARLIEPSHVVILGLIIAFVGVIWQMRHPRQAPVGSHSAATVSQKSGSTLVEAVDAFLAKQGKTARWNDRIDGHAYVSLGSVTGLRDDESILFWDPSLGPWPTTDDGFSASQLRTLPKKFPQFTTQYDKEKFRQAVDDLSAVIDQQGNEIVTLSLNVAGVTPINAGSADASIPLQKLRKLRETYSRVSELLDNGGQPTFFPKYPAYRNELMGIVPDGTQAVLVDYSIALQNLTRAVSLIAAGYRHPDDRELNETAMTNVRSYQDQFRAATAKMKNWIEDCDRRMDMMTKAIR